MNTSIAGRASSQKTLSEYCLCRTDAGDVDEHAQNLSAWSQHYDQLAPGRFAGELLEYWTPDAQVFFEKTSHAVRQRCRVWDDAVWFGLPVRHDGTRIEGREAPACSLLTQLGGHEFVLDTPSDHAIFGIVIRQQALNDFAAVQGCALDWPALSSGGWLQVSPSAIHTCLQQLQSLFVALSYAAPSLGDPAASNLSHDILGAVLPLLEHPLAADEPARAFGRHRKLVQAVEEYARQHPDWVPDVPELCKRFYVSRRTLQYAFEDALGISPTQYLRALRLNGVRRCLRQSAAGELTVKDLALAWGFWNLSQFSQDYRKLFGERPSDTLGKA